MLIVQIPNVFRLSLEASKFYSSKILKLYAPGSCSRCYKMYIAGNSSRDFLSITDTVASQMNKTDKHWYMYLNEIF